MEVGFLGTGRMGKVMAANLLKAGNRVAGCTDMQQRWESSEDRLESAKIALYPLSAGRIRMQA
jgi:3-hydroxyisobutyrate dehydrogenase-like beta-hydroxyacid dehydrogenase